MLNIDLNPIVFSVGTFEVRWYGVMVVLAVVALIGIALLEAKRRNISQDTIWDVGLWGVIGGILGSRILHVIDQWEYYFSHPEQLLNFAGLAVWGAVLGAAAALLIYCRVKKLSFWLMADLVAPGAILAQAIGRIGCLINGCCYGNTCELPIAVIYLHPASYAPQGVPLYPTQIFHFIWNMGGFVLLWLLRKHTRPDGVLFFIWMIYFSAGDFVIRFFRGDTTPFMFNLPEAQVVDIAVVAVSIIMLAVLLVRNKKDVPAAEAAEASTNGRNQAG
ncbi:MAG: prolipoprotein diacylglyceryl transferase [Dehalococcoidia bacterium]|nr:prolipoprotein diacylglyceryl transferase [Dehalococcoidia bacterium]